MFLNRLFSSFATPSFLACYDRSPGQVELRRVLAGSAPESLPRRGRLGWKRLVCWRIAGTEDMLVTHLAKLSSYQTQCLFYLLSRCMARLCRVRLGASQRTGLEVSLYDIMINIDDGGSHRSQNLDYFSDYTFWKYQGTTTMPQVCSR